MTEDELARARADVRSYYGDRLTGTHDLRTGACCASAAPPPWLAARIAEVHPDVRARFYGCGVPIPHALADRTVLDLGCGSGRDVFVLSQLVGPRGRVIGIDMTEAQLEVARGLRDWHAERFRHASPNTELRLGYIEDLAAAGIAPESVDAIVSNCVVNLSPAKALVLSEAFAALRTGGELYLSDVFADRRLPSSLGSDAVLRGECLGGAAYLPDFLALARRAGFADPRVLSSAPIAISDPEIARRIGAARFHSVTLRLFKLPGLDEACEDYGQLAVYRGGIEGAEAVYWLDDHHAFEVGRAERVCANTAAMLGRSRLGAFFEILGTRDTHFGAFPCGPTLAAATHAPGAGAQACC